jgi:hypothetical protein
VATASRAHAGLSLCIAATLSANNHIVVVNDLAYDNPDETHARRPRTSTFRVLPAGAIPKFPECRIIGKFEAEGPFDVAETRFVGTMTKFGSSVGRLVSELPIKWEQTRDQFPQAHFL